MTSTGRPGRNAPSGGAPGGGQPVPVEVPAERAERAELSPLLRDLRTSPAGLSSREAARRLEVVGPNELRRRGGVRWPAEVVRQLSHPLALLLWLAAALSAVTGTITLAGAIVAVIALNAALSLLQERQAERAVEALAGFLPRTARAVRDGRAGSVDVRQLVPGDVVLLGEGDRVGADVRLLDGSLEVDMSTLTGEPVPVSRVATTDADLAPLLQARELAFSGTTCLSGHAHAVVFATGMHTELGRIAALSQRVSREDSPLERQVRRVAWLIAAVAVGVGLAFLPLGVVGAGLSFSDSAIFAIGLLVANVPEGLLPTITLALAVGVRTLARAGALVKRLSAVETLGSTTVICTDKTGTLTENRMRAVAAWTDGGDLPLTADQHSSRAAALATALAACSNATVDPVTGRGDGDPTEVALLAAAASLEADVSATRRISTRRGEYPFDPALRLMSTVDATADGWMLHCKGAPEAVLARTGELLGADGQTRPCGAVERARLAAVLDRYADQGLRVLAAARRPLTSPPGRDVSRERVERDLVLVGLVALADPPRPEVAGAVRQCHTAGVRVHMVTGDHPLTAAAVARAVGIGTPGLRLVVGADLDRMTETNLDALLSGPDELVFARSSPEAKLRIADALRAQGHVVAMTGDGVNDAPALRRADIGVAMGRSGTDVAREAATIVLTDDNFATIVTAIEAGRRVYDNVRKFILYIFAHAVPEVTPFLIYALSGGAVPLPLTVLQILAIDLGTETVPALALGREPAEPGIMSRPPRPRQEGVIRPVMLLRAWGVLGLVSAALVLTGFFAVLYGGGWHPGDPVGAGQPLHTCYLQATTMTFLGIVACQIGTALAARTERASLRTVGLTTNPLLLAGIAFELAFAAALVYLPPLRVLFGTQPVPAPYLLLLVPFPFIVWAADELFRAALRRHHPQPT